MLGCHFRFDAAPRAAVFRNYDSALHGDAALSELVVVRGHAIVHEDQRASHISVDRVSIIRWELLGLLIGSGINGDGRLLQLRSERRWSNELDDALDGSREENVEILDVCIQTV